MPTAPGQQYYQESNQAPQVSIGDINFTDDAKYQVPEPGTVFADYLVNSYYYKCYHTYQMGVSSPVGFQGDSCAFVKLANPTLLWVVDWTAMKLGKQPQSPNSTAPPGWVLLDEQIIPAMIVIGADGVTPFYRISGTYLYGCRRPSSILVNDVSYPLPPWLEPDFDRTQPVDRMVQGVASPAVQDMMRRG